MADKKTTLKTKAGDNVYPNVLDGNIPATIARTSDIQATYATKSDVNTISQSKQDKLTPGDNITINDNVISATTGGSVPDNVVLYGDLTPVA